MGFTIRALLVRQYSFGSWVVVRSAGGAYGGNKAIVAVYSPRRPEARVLGLVTIHLLPINNALPVTPSRLFSCVQHNHSLRDDLV